MLCALPATLPLDSPHSFRAKLQIPAPCRHLPIRSRAIPVQARRPSCESELQRFDNHGQHRINAADLLSVSRAFARGRLMTALAVLLE